MQAMIWIGVVLALIGVAGLGYCVLRVVKAKRAGLDDDAMRTELRRVITLNLGAVGVSALGLMLVVAGVLLD